MNVPTTARADSNCAKLAGRVPAVPDYRLIRPIGRGAYGEVWLGLSATGTYRAIKVVNRSSFGNDRPFEREFSGILRFEPVSRRHDSQVDLLHVGRSENCFYYVMELADDQASGQQIDPDSYVPRSLANDLSRRGRMAFDDCVRIGLALTTALKHLHESGLVHRDVKPSNIIYVNGVPKLADIGLVTGTDATKSFVGTEGFAPPEGPGSPQADIYSLGKVLYELSTGKDRQDFPELPTNIAGMPDYEGLIELNAIIGKACRRDAQQRYKTAAEMHADLVALQGGKSIARAHHLQRRLRLLGKISVVGAAVAAFAIAALLLQSRQAREVRKWEAKARRSVERLQMGNAMRALSDGLPGTGLLWMAGTLPSLRDDPIATERRRLLLGSALDQFPHLIRMFGPEQAVVRLAFSADGTILACLGVRAVMAYSVASGSLLYSTPCPRISETLAANIAFSKDGAKIVVRRFGLGEEAAIYDSATGKEILPPGGSRPEVSRWLDCLDDVDGLVALWYDGESKVTLMSVGASAFTGEITVSMQDSVVSGRISEDGRHFALISTKRPGLNTYEPETEDELRVWDASTGEPVGPPLTLDRGSEYMLNRNGSQLHLKAPAWSKQLSYRVLDVKSGTPLPSPASPEERFSGFFPLPGGSWIEWSGPAGERLWNIDTGENSRVSGTGRGLAFDSSGLLIAVANDNAQVKVLQRGSGKVLAGPMMHTRWAYGVAFSPDGHLLASTSDDKTIRVWDLATIVQPDLVLRHRTRVINAVIAPDGHRLVALGAGMRVWDRDTGKPLTSQFVEECDRGELVFSRSGSEFLSFAGTGLRRGHERRACFGALLWKLDQIQEKPLSLHENAIVHHAEFSPDERWIVTAGADNFARLWRADSGGLWHELQHERQVTWAAFQPNGVELATTTEGGPVSFWNIQTGKKTRELAPQRWFTHVVFSPAGDRFATAAGDQSIRLWSSDTLAPLSPALFFGGTPSHAQFSPNGKLLLAWNRWGLRLWDASDGKSLVADFPHGVGDVAFSSDARLLASCGDDGRARLWDTLTGDPISVPFGADVTSVQLDPRMSNTIVTAEAGHVVTFWRLRACKHSPAQVVGLAELLSGLRLRDSDVTALDREELPELYGRLRGEVPDRFKPSENPQRALWHESLGELAFADEMYQAAVWHLDRALELDPTLVKRPTGDEILRQRAESRRYAAKSRATVSR